MAEAEAEIGDPEAGPEAPDAEARKDAAEARMEEEREEQAEDESPAEPMMSLPASVESATADVERLLRLQGQTVEALFRRVQQIAAEMTDAIAEMRELSEDTRAMHELMSRWIGQFDDLTQRHGRATAAQIELHERQMARDQAQQAKARQ